MAEKIAAAEAEKLVEKPSSETTGGLPPEKGLEILGTEPETLITNIGPISIAPMCMDQIANFIVVAEHLLPHLAAGEKGGRLPIGKMLAQDKEAVWKAIAIACNTTPENIAALYPNDFIKVVTKVFVLNLDFFVRTLPVALGVAEASVLSAVKKLAAQDTPSWFSGLSTMGIPSKQ